MFNKKNILITGGTGSFGKKFVEIVLNKLVQTTLKDHNLEVIIIPKILMKITIILEKIIPLKEIILKKEMNLKVMNITI